jgi:hypothetical protein
MCVLRELQGSCAEALQGRSSGPRRRRESQDSGHNREIGQGECWEAKNERLLQGRTVDSVVLQWYNDKLTELSPLHNVYLSPTPANSEAFIALSRQNWSHMIDVLYAVEKLITGPYTLGDQISLADLHVVPWLARLMAIACQLEGEKDEVVALEKALAHECLQSNAFAKQGLGAKVRPIPLPCSKPLPTLFLYTHSSLSYQITAYWTNVKARPSFEAVYGSGLH